MKAVGPILALSIPIVAHGAPVNSQSLDITAHHSASGAQHSDIRRPETLGRLVRHFDFEEAEEAPYEMPLNFYRYAAEDGAAAQGFPPFGSMRLSNEVAYSGNWSFEFELDGGSLAARVPTAVIPIMPMADYVILTRVRTEGLAHARARLSAWLHDKRGKIIEESRVHSRLVNTDGRWDTLAVHVRGRWQDAADLVIELQLLQPRQFIAPRRSETAGAPLMEDVRGRAWFDDVTVWHVPRVEMNLKFTGEHSELTMMVLDVAHHELVARLRVFDLNGTSVFDRTFPAPRTPMARSIELPLERYGWYQAVLDIKHNGELTARRTLDFVHGPPQSHIGERGGSISFGLAMPESWRGHANELPMMAREAGASTVILPVLSRDMTLATAGDAHAASRSAIEELRHRGVDLIFALSSVPEELARQLDIPADDVLFLLRGEPTVWHEYLDDLLVHFAFAVERWQIGPTGGGEAFWHRDLASIIANTRRGLSRFVPDPIIHVPLLAEHTGLFDSRSADARTITMPYGVRPDAIKKFGRVADRNSIIVLDLPPRDLYQPRERVADLAFRMLHSWRAGATALAIEPPWRADDDGRLMPDATLAAWRNLASHLRNRRFAGELAIGPGGHAWILEDESSDDAAIIAWRDHVRQHDHGSTGPQVRTQHSTLNMQLAERAVRAVDLFGNVTNVPLVGGEHAVQLDELPIVIEGISASLVRFRSGFVLDPPHIAAEARAHRHEIVLRNPWNTPVSGTIQIADDPQWRVTPRSQDFLIRPGGEVRLPVNIVLDRGIIAGRKALRAQAILSADGNYRVDLETEVEVGLENAEMSATWRIARNVETGEDDLIITQYISNKGANTINGDAFIIAPGVRQERRLVAGLEPGEVAVRSFHVPGGASLLAGRTIRIGLASRDTPARLNLLVEIPPLGQLRR